MLATLSEEMVRTLPVDAGETAITYGQRVYIKVSNGKSGVAVAGISDLDIGFADMDWSSNTTTSAPARGIKIRLHGPPRIGVAAGAITAGTQVGRAASGKITTGTDLPYVAWQSAAANNEQISLFRIAIDTATQPTGGS